MPVPVVDRGGRVQKPGPLWYRMRTATRMPAQSKSTATAPRTPAIIVLLDIDVDELLLLAAGVDADWGSGERDREYISIFARKARRVDPLTGGRRASERTLRRLAVLAVSGREGSSFMQAAGISGFRGCYGQVCGAASTA